MSYGHEQQLSAIEVAKIHPSPYQPRKIFNDEDLKDLAASMKESGLLQPVSVRPVNGEYELVAGERRFRAAQLLKWPRISAIVRPMGNADAALLCAIENLQRKDLTPVEEADALQALMTQHKLTQVQLALKTGIPRSTIQARLALLTLGPWLELLRAGEITVSQAVRVQQFKTKTEAEHLEAIRRMRDQGIGELSAMSVDSFGRTLGWQFSEIEYEQSEKRPAASGDAQDDGDAWDGDDEDAEAGEPARPRTDWEAKQREQREAAERKEAARRAQLAEIIRRAPAVWDGVWWRAAIGWMLDAGFHYQAERQTCLLLGLPDPDELEAEEIGGEDPPSPILAYAATLPDAELPRLAITLLLAGDVYVNPWSREEATPQQFTAAAQLLGVSLDDLTKPEPQPMAKTAKTKKSLAEPSHEPFMKPFTPSDQLAKIVGAAPLARTEVTKKLWSYIKMHGLQDATNRRMINADDVLRPIFGQDQISMFDMTKRINAHLEGALETRKTGTKWERRNKRGSPKHAAAEA